MIFDMLKPLLRKLKLKVEKVKLYFKNKAIEKKRLKDARTKKEQRKRLREAE